MRRPPLRVAVLIDSLIQPAWVPLAVEAIRESGEAVIDVFIVAASTTQHASRPSAFARAYRAIDAFLFRRTGEAAMPVDVRPVMDGAPQLQASLPLTTEDISRLRERHLDVIISFAGEVSAPGAARQIWWFRHGIGQSTHPGFAEFASQHAVTEAALETMLHGRRVTIERTRAATDRISFTRGLNQLYVQSVPLAARAIARLRRGARPTPLVRPVVSSRRDEGETSLRLLPRTIGRLAAQKFRDRLTREQWFVGFDFRGFRPGEENFSTFHKILPPRDRLWADPFVVSEGDVAWIFVEEMTFRERRGTIAVIEARRDGSWSPAKRILETPYHLSYPCVFAWKGEWFMVPESAQNRAVDLYRATSFPWSWEHDTTLFAEIAADTSVFEHDGRWWAMFATPAFGRNYEELWIHHADSPRGPWHPHVQNPVLSDAIGGRPAGNPFVLDGRLYRPAQNGSRRYGYAIDIREITLLTPDEFEERAVAEILPDWHPGILGTHTLNTDGRVTVIDGVRRQLGIKRRR